MNINTEMRLDKSKVTHIKIKDGFKGIDSGWGISQYKYLEAKYNKFLRWKYIKHQEGYYKDGRQY